VGVTAAHFNFARDVVEHWARQTPNAPALWWVGEGGRGEVRLTFAQLARQLRCAADFFNTQGIGPGDRVLVMLPRVPQWWVAMLGLIRLGAVPVPATLLLTARDVAYRLETARISAVITSPEGIEKVDGFKGTMLLVGGHQPGWQDFDAGLK